jgi:hypothetical protein
MDEIRLAPARDDVQLLIIIIPFFVALWNY